MADRDKQRKEAIVLFASGKAAEALHVLESLVGPEGGGIIEDHLLYASIRFSSGNPLAAAEFLKSALVTYPDEIRLMADLGLYLAAAGADEESLPHLMAAHATSPDDLNILSALAFVLTRLGREKDAKSYGGRVLELRDQLSMAGDGLALQKKTRESKFNSDQPERNIIAFSLWGENAIYLDGAMENARLAPHLFPEWQCRFYVDGSVPGDVIGELLAAGANVIHMPDQEKIFEGLFWRFHVVSDPDIDRFMVRDADSLLTLRERAAVDEWLQSEKPFHIMRDSAAHTSLILAGSWGGMAGRLPDLAPHYRSYLDSARQTASVDQTFLGEVVWPAIKEHVLIHDDVYELFGARKFLTSALKCLPSPIGRKYRLADRGGFGSFKNHNQSGHAAPLKITFVLGPRGSGFASSAGATKTEEPAIAAEYLKRGNTARVEQYWRNKLASMIMGAKAEIRVMDSFAMFAGLVENIILLKDHLETKFLWHHTAISHVAARLLLEMRSGDLSLQDLTGMEMTGRRKIVSPAPLELLDAEGAALWYAIEQETRQHYFRRLLADETSIESHWLEKDDPLVAGLNTKDPDQKSLERIEALLKTANFNPSRMADSFYDAGRRLG